MLINPDGTPNVGMAMLAGVIGGLLTIALMFATGQTFGQRCAKVYPENTPEWIDCVQRFAAGR